MTPLRSLTSDRRTVLTALATGLSTVGLAGCVDTIDTDEATDDAGSNDDGTSNEADSDDGTTEDANSSDESSDIHAEYESTDVRVRSPEGDELGEVTAAIADTPELQVLGLSDTEELPEDRGMLFVYESVEDREFVMREMSFGIDIVYADDEGVITGIEHAPEPGPDEDGSEQTYPGRGQYVLEVGYEWTADRDVEEGDVLEFEL